MQIGITRSHYGAQRRGTKEVTIERTRTICFFSIFLSNTEDQNILSSKYFQISIEVLSKVSRNTIETKNYHPTNMINA